MTVSRSNRSDVVVYVNDVSGLVLLRHWREKRGYSLRELAQRAGVTYVTISRIENGHVSPTVQMLEKLAKALGIGLRDFFPVEQRTTNRKSGR